MKSQGMTKVNSIDSEEDMNVCTKFNDSPYDRLVLRHFTQNNKCQPQSEGYIIWEPWMPVQNFLEIHCWDISDIA